MTQECQHIEKHVTVDGNIVERPWKNIFCPDCGRRIQESFPTNPFKLRGR
jgi:hypothetical protein